MYSNLALLVLQKFDNKIVLERVQQQNLVRKLPNISKSNKPDAGFSMVELLAVVMIIGILAVMALPNWTAFVNRQRVNKVNDAVLAAIQEAQRQAKRQKASYSVSFKVENQLPKVVIHPDTETASSITNSRWQTLGQDLQIQPGQVILLTNLTSKNTAGSSVNSNSNYLNTPQTITFDYMGTLPNANFGTAPTGSDETPGIRVVTGTTGRIRRCVILKTLLGATLTNRDDKCG